ncbi:MAG: response regulator [Fusobacteriaceae bacterium]
MKTVLIVEDDPMVAMINMEYLSNIKEIKVVGHTSNKNQTLKFIQENSVDLILLDIFLGNDNGLEILKEIRDLGYTTDVIMITSANRSSDVKKALSLGSVDYLIKPFDFERFKSAINKFQKFQDFFNEDKITQLELDTIYNKDEKIISCLPKGLNFKTLENIKKEIENFSGEFNIKDICKKTDISNVTIKKYLDYLENSGEIEGSITYGNIGRPIFLYRKKNKYPIF